MTVLQCGSYEPLKTGFHATALGLMAVMGLYNAAAWLQRRDTRLAVNAVLYTALTIWEQKHVAHHVAVLRRCRTVPGTVDATPSVRVEVGARRMAA
jgi:hypothetical protein